MDKFNDLTAKQKNDLKADFNHSYNKCSYVSQNKSAGNGYMKVAFDKGLALDESAIFSISKTAKNTNTRYYITVKYGRLNVWFFAKI